MLVLTHHTNRTVEAPLALVEDTGTMEVVPRLPPDLAAQARTPNACQRVRSLATPVDLWRAVLAYVLGALSTRRLGAWAVLSGLADIRGGRRAQTAAGLSAVVALAPQRPGGHPGGGRPAALRPRGRVLRVEASTLRQPGGTGDDWRLHWA